MHLVNCIQTYTCYICIYYISKHAYLPQCKECAAPAIGFKKNLSKISVKTSIRQYIAHKNRVKYKVIQLFIECGIYFMCTSWNCSSKCKYVRVYICIDMCTCKLHTCTCKCACIGINVCACTYKKCGNISCRHTCHVCDIGMAS